MEDMSLFGSLSHKSSSIFGSRFDCLWLQYCPFMKAFRERSPFKCLLSGTTASVLEDRCAWIVKRNNFLIWNFENVQ